MERNCREGRETMDDCLHDLMDYHARLWFSIDNKRLQV
jgi:hypothetical protein